jgi:mRNA interferase MazF
MTIKPSLTRCHRTGKTTPDVRRGDIYTAAARGGYSGKPLPVVIIQDDRFDATASVTVVPFTTAEVDAPLLRLPVQPLEITGLAQRSHLMVDKVTTIPRTSLTQHLGRLSDADILQLNRTLVVFLGLAVSPSSRRPDRSSSKGPPAASQPRIPKGILAGSRANDA